MDVAGFILLCYSTVACMHQIYITFMSSLWFCSRLHASEPYYFLILIMFLHDSLSHRDLVLSNRVQLTTNVKKNMNENEYFHKETQLCLYLRSEMQESQYKRHIHLVEIFIFIHIFYIHSGVCGLATEVPGCASCLGCLMLEDHWLVCSGGLQGLKKDLWFIFNALSFVCSVFVLFFQKYFC